MMNIKSNIIAKENSNRIFKMNIKKIFDNCSRLENTLLYVVKHNGSKKLEVNKLREKLIFSCDANKFGIDIETRTSEDLKKLTAKKDELEDEIKQYDEVNKRISSLLEENKTNGAEQEEKIDQVYVEIMSDINEYEKTVEEFDSFKKANLDLREACEKHKTDIQSVGNLIQSMNFRLSTDEKMTILADKQRQISEKQFDVVLDNIPWEPLEEEHMEVLRNADSERLRNLALVVQMQTDESKQLRESLDVKIKRKLNILEQLVSHLSDFARARDEAKTIADLN